MSFYEKWEITTEIFDSGNFLEKFDSSFQKKKKKKKIKGPLFHCRENSNHKYWWGSKTLSLRSKYILKPGIFSIEFLTKAISKLQKLRSQNFKTSFDVRRPGNRKHRFSITWILYQLTNLCSNYSIQWNQMSDICKVWKNEPLKCGFRSIS